MRWLRRLLVTLLIVTLFPWVVVDLHDHKKLPAYADQYVQPTIIFGTGVVTAIGNAVGSLGSFVINNGSWANPVTQYNASCQNTTGLGYITTGTAALSLSYNLHLPNGAGVAVTGAGAAGAILTSTVLSGGSIAPLGTGAVTLANNASTTVLSTAPGTVYAIGSIGATSNLLTLATTAGWSVGMGIDVATVGTSGADLISSVTAVSPTQLTLANNSVTAGTNVKINHDETAALIAAAGTGLNVQLPIGQCNVTSQLSVAYAQWLQGSGAVLLDYNGATSGGTVIWNRGRTNNVLNVTGSFPSISDFAIEQAFDITPTAGYGLQIGTGSRTTYIVYGKVFRVAVWNTYHILNINEGVSSWEIDGLFYGGPFTASPLVTINNPPSAGDIKWNGSEIANQTGNNLDLVAFTASDTMFWTGVKFNGCGPCITTPGGASVINQNFIGSSFEGSAVSGAGAMVQIIGGTKLAERPARQRGGRTQRVEFRCTPILLRQTPATYRLTGAQRRRRLIGRS